MVQVVRKAHDHSIRKVEVGDGSCWNVRSSSAE